MKIWSKKIFLRSIKDIRPILMPFWGSIKSEGPQKNRFNKWESVGKDIFTLVNNLDEADLAVYPQDPQIDPRGFQKFQKITGKTPLVVFYNSDSMVNIPMRENSILLRTSVLRSKKKSCEFGLPGWSEDWGFLGLRPKDNIPIIGFCGQDYNPKVRSAALDILQKSKKVKTNFIRKKQFWGGWISGGRKPDHGISLRHEFIENMKQCDYGFCARGGGNFSYRLYETMMSGRIPILIDTDCLLPYDFLINWNNYFPVVKESNIKYMPDIVENFHKTFSTTEDFNDHQKLIRTLWEKYISPTGFFSNLHKHFQEIA